MGAHADLSRTSRLRWARIAETIRRPSGLRGAGSFDLTGAKLTTNPASAGSIANLVGPGRFELPTSPLSGVRSNQLSYGPEPWGSANRTRRSDWRSLLSSHPTITANHDEDTTMPASAAAKRSGILSSIEERET